MFVQPDEDPRGDLIVIGGGCYGSFHARQLDKARAKGKIEARDIVIVDRDPGCAAFREFNGLQGFRFIVSGWDDFYDRYYALRSPETRDRVAPTPVAPHLMFRWLMRRAEAASRGSRTVEFVPSRDIPATPYAVTTEQGTGLLSFATWICPVACIEPAICPETRGPKDWEMDDAVYAFARKKSLAGEPFDSIEVFRCRHYAWGVATFPTAHAVRAGRRIDRLAAPGGLDRERRILVATVSSCHGILDTFRISGSA